MNETRKPKIGLLGIMHGLYDESQPEITLEQEGFARDVIKKLESNVDIDFPGAAKSREQIESYIREFNYKRYDGIIIIMLLYSPGFRLVRALEDNNLPVLLANIQPIRSVTNDWNWSLLTTNQGIHGAQDTANMLLQAGTTTSVITDDWNSDEFTTYVEDWAVAAKCVNDLKRQRIAVFGRMKGMGDIVGDEGNFHRVIGPEVNHEGIGQIYRLMERVSDGDVAEQVKTDFKNFNVSNSLNPENHKYAVRMQLAFEKFLLENRYSGFTVNFDTFKEDGRFKQIQMLAGSNLMAKGYGYSNEGDIHTCAMVSAGHIIGNNGHFTEMYSLDFDKNSALMSHMGEGNWKIARKDRPIRLIDRPLEIGGLENPPTVVFSAEPGPATLISLASITGVGYRLIICQGTILDTPELVDVPMPHFHFQPETGILSAMDNWLLSGGTHHEVLTLGKNTRRWKMLADILKIEKVEV